MLIPGFFSNSEPVNNINTEYRFGFNGMLRDDDVRDKNAQISAEEGRGNSYSTEFRGYDPRRGQWLSPDPLAYKFPWSSSYVALGNNPMIMVDPDGDWFWTANNNKTLFNFIMKYDSDQTVIKTMDKKSLEETNKKLNSLVDVWSDPKSPHYAPNIADFVKNENNRIPVLVGTIGAKSVGGYCKPGEFKQGMKNPIVIKEDLDPAKVIHETIHHIYGSSEFDAYSGMLAAGYYDDVINGLVSGSYTDELLWGDEENNELRELMNSLNFGAENYAQSNGRTTFVERKDINGKIVKVQDPSKVINEMKTHGKEIIGTKSSEDKKK